MSLYSFLEQDSAFGFASYAQPSARYGTWGVSLIDLRSSGFEKRATGATSSQGSYNLSQTAFLISDGMKINERLALGLTLKAVRQEVDSFSGTGYGADIGFLIPLHQKLQLGVVVRNLVAPRLTLRLASENYPREIGLGFKFQAARSLLLATDLKKMESRSTKLNLGTEWKANKFLALRA